MGRDVEIRIAFKGQAKALKQFRNMLVPAGAGAGMYVRGKDGSRRFLGKGMTSDENTSGDSKTPLYIVAMLR